MLAMTHDDHDCCGGEPHAARSAGLDDADAGTADLSGPAEAPILVEVTRGGMVESVHRGRACIVDAHGHIQARWGDVTAPVYPRSAIKPLQAIPFAESGAMAAFDLTDAELALACASHNGEYRHTRLAAQWLGKIGLATADLECGVHPPYDAETAAELIRNGEEPTTLHNNCSGKHLGFLTTARHKGEPTRGYVRFDHPVQQRVLGVLEQMTGQDLSAAPWGVDGCAIPTIGIPLEALAYGMARIADPHDLPDHRAEAVHRIRMAWLAHPYLIAGRDTFDTNMMRAATGHALVKSGAEGVGCAVMPRLGLGLALKIEDGSARARDVAMAALIRATGAMSAESWNRNAGFLCQPVTNRNGAEVGTVRLAAGWAEG